METALLLLLFCLAEADDIRWEVKDMFQRFKSQLEGQHADMASRLSASETKMEEMVAANNNLTLELSRLKTAHTNLNLEMTQLKSEVNKLKSKTAAVEELSVPPRPVRCPSGWTEFGGSCYYHYRLLAYKTWQQSRQHCQYQGPGADLVVINSREEQDFIVRLRGGDKIVIGWIGLSDRETEGVWKWVDGTPLTTPTYWESGQPNGGVGEDCAVFYNGGWSDYPCGTAREWICEI